MSGIPSLRDIVRVNQELEDTKTCSGMGVSNMAYFKMGQQSGLCLQAWKDPTYTPVSVHILMGRKS